MQTASIATRSEIDAPEIMDMLDSLIVSKRSASDFGAAETTPMSWVSDEWASTDRWADWDVVMQCRQSTPQSDTPMISKRYASDLGASDMTPMSWVSDEWASADRWADWDGVMQCLQLNGPHLDRPASEPRGASRAESEAKTGSLPSRSLGKNLRAWFRGHGQRCTRTRANAAVTR